MRKSKSSILVLTLNLLLRFLKNNIYVTKCCLTKTSLYVGILSVTLLTACTHYDPRTNPVYAETPEQVTRQYLDNIKKQDWEAVSLLFHEDSLTEFKDSLMPIFIDDDAKDFSNSLFGEITVPEIKALDPHVFFSAFLKNIFAAKINTGIKGKSQQVIGGVAEDTDLHHVLVRISTPTLGKKIVMNDWSVISLKPEKNNRQTWRILIDDKIKRHAHVIKLKLLSF